ncbi:MAG TPA: response regulator [Thermodesulfobacteriota bacterium]|nr:response regulator [Thermodesulfobacteriota bacterium]
MNQSPTILLVDDEETNIKLLKAHFQRAGYNILTALNGEETINLARQKPDLILLDVMMPGLDGLQTCRILKKDAGTEDIPIIFLSALEDAESRTQGLEAGGVDFVSKPFNGRELLARVRNHLTIKDQERQLKEYALKLEDMVQERTRQLVHAERLATLGTFAAATLHEINNPNAAIQGSAELGKYFCQKVKELAGRPGGTDWAALTKALDQLEARLDAIFVGSRRITEIARTLKGYARKEGAQKTRCSLIDPIKATMGLLHHRLKSGVSVDLQIPPDLQVDCQPQELSQVFVNLLNNAMDAMAEEKGKVIIKAELSGTEIIIQVEDNGPGIPQEIERNLFEPFFTTKDPSRGTGLGLFIIRNIIDEHQGKIVLIRNDATGATFQIRLPVLPAWEN